MITLAIDGRQVTVPAGTSILDAAKTRSRTLRDDEVFDLVSEHQAQRA